MRDVKIDFHPRVEDALVAALRAITTYFTAKAREIEVSRSGERA